MDKDKLPEQGKTVRPQTDKVQTEPKAPESGPLAPAALSETTKVDAMIEAGTSGVYKIISSGLVPKTDLTPHRMTKVYRAKTGKWEYMSTEGNPGPPDGGDDAAASPDKAKGKPRRKR